MKPFFVAIALVASVSLAAAQARLEVETKGLESDAVARTLKYQIIFPASYEKERDRRFPVLYLLHGYGGNYTDWARALGAPTYAASYDLILVMPDAGNSRYVNWSRSADGEKNDWEDFVIGELIPHVDSTYRTVATREGRAITGLSMGGYGALTLGLRHPELFVSVGSISGSLSWARRAAERLRASDSGDDVESQRDDVSRQEVDDPVIDIEGFSSQTDRTPSGVLFSSAREATAHDPFRLITRVAEPMRPHIYLDCGTGDGLFEETKSFAELLLRNDIPFVYSQTAGGHDAAFWIEALGRALAVQNEVLMRSLDLRPRVRRRP